MPNLNAIGEIYDTATNLGRWRRALDGVATDIGAKAIALKIREPHSDVADLDMLSSDYLAFSRSASGLYYGLRYSRLQQDDWEYLSRQPVHHPALDEHLSIGIDALDARRDYAFLRRKIGVRRRMGVRLNSDRLWFDAVSAAFPVDVDSVSPVSITNLQHYLPHLTKAVELGRMFRLLQAKYRAALDALDHVQVGLAIAVPSGEIIVQNAEASRLLDARKSLWKQKDGRLASNKTDAIGRLNTAVAQACKVSAGQGKAAEWLETFTSGQDQMELLVDIAPLSDGRAEIERGLNAALLTLIDPDNVPKLKLSRFARLYGLTAAETDVCSMMLDGLTATEIAERRDTSPVTAKNQMSAVLSKAGVNRRAELIRLLMRVQPPVR